MNRIELGVASAAVGGQDISHIGGEAMKRRDFLSYGAKGLLVPVVFSVPQGLDVAGRKKNDLFWIRDVPDEPLRSGGGVNRHRGVDALLDLMGDAGLKFYKTGRNSRRGGPKGLIAAKDVVLVKVNAQWKYRGCTNSDLVRGLVQAILDHPSGFTGEVVIFENGQGRGSLKCDTSAAYGNSEIHANANDEAHSFVYLVDHVFRDPRVSAYLLDPVGSTLIGPDDHSTDGYRVLESVSYPCFTTRGGRRVELREGLWSGGRMTQNLKLINVPVLKYHDTGGSEYTAAVKHFYGVLSMRDGRGADRHYAKLGQACASMIRDVRTPVLNIIDAIWVSHSSLRGYPSNTTFRANQILASQDPVALDYWAGKSILYPISGNPRHLPSFAGVDAWLRQAADYINGRGGLYNEKRGIFVSKVTLSERRMRVLSANA